MVPEHTQQLDKVVQELNNPFVQPQRLLKLIQVLFVLKFGCEHRYTQELAANA